MSNQSTAYSPISLNLCLYLIFLLNDEKVNKELEDKL